jgi:hypothetical protein
MAATQRTRTSSPASSYCRTKTCRHCKRSSRSAAELYRVAQESPATDHSSIGHRSRDRVKHRSSRLGRRLLRGVPEAAFAGDEADGDHLG